MCRGLFFVSYELQGKLGEGAFGEARLARRRKVLIPESAYFLEIHIHT